jgi:hypothetical protein
MEEVIHQATLPPQYVIVFGCVSSDIVYDIDYLAKCRWNAASIAKVSEVGSREVGGAWWGSSARVHHPSHCIHSMTDVMDSGPV